MYFWYLPTTLFLSQTAWSCCSRYSYCSHFSVPVLACLIPLEGKQANPKPIKEFLDTATHVATIWILLTTSSSSSSDFHHCAAAIEIRLCLGFVRFLLAHHGCYNSSFHKPSLYSAFHMCSSSIKNFWTPPTHLQPSEFCWIFLLHHQISPLCCSNWNSLASGVLWGFCLCIMAVTTRHSINPLCFLHSICAHRPFACSQLSNNKQHKANGLLVGLLQKTGSRGGRMRFILHHHLQTRVVSDLCNAALQQASSTSPSADSSLAKVSTSSQRKSVFLG